MFAESCGNPLMDAPGVSPNPGVEKHAQQGPQIGLEPTKAAEPSSVFFGPDGLRAGWRVLLYLAFAKGLYAFLGPLLRSLPLRGLRLELAAELGLLITAWVPGLVFAVYEDRPLGVYGLPACGAFRKNFWLGALWGLSALSLLMLAMHLAGLYDITAVALHGDHIWQYAIFWVVFFVIVGLYEEFLTRGYSQYTLTKGVGFWPSAFLLSFLFGALHMGNEGETLTGLAAVVVIGLFFCLTLWRTGTLWFAVGFHMAWDWGESYLYSVPDSGGIAPGHLLRTAFHGPKWLTGGSVGPEGSVLVFVLFIVLFAAFHRAYPKVKYTL